MNLTQTQFEILTTIFISVIILLVNGILKLAVYAVKRYAQTLR